MLLGPGEVVGEIAMFSPTRRRTRTIVAETDARLLSIGESELKQLYYQNPHFGFYLIQLVTRRLVANVERLEEKVRTVDPERKSGVKTQLRSN
jgi:CRP-like cAMP-binding protein